MSERTISTLDLTEQEQENVRNVLYFLRIRLDGWKYLGKLLHFDETTIIHVANGRRAVCASMAFRVGRVVKVSIDDLLAGKFPQPGECPRCGYRDSRPANGKRGTR
jgi:hypothetical protein